MSAEGQHLCSDVLDACTADQDVRGLCRSGSNDQAQRADVEVPMLGPADERAVLAAEEARRIASMATPLVLEEALSYASTLISLAYAGRLGARALSVFALSHSLTNITGIALLNGVTGALDTFGSQAHGSGNFAAIGVALQRAVLLSLLTSLPLLALYAASPWVLRALLRQEAGLAAAAGRYTRIFAPKVPLHAVILCMYRALASQGAAAKVPQGTCWPPLPPFSPPPPQSTTCSSSRWVGGWTALRRRLWAPSWCMHARCWPCVWRTTRGRCQPSAGGGAGRRPRLQAGARLLGCRSQPPP